MTVQRSATLLAALGLLLGGRAQAGLLDSPPLSLGGASASIAISKVTLGMKLRF